MAESAARAGYAVTTLDAFGDLDQHDGVHALSLPRDFGVAFTSDAAARLASEITCDAVAYLSPFENHARAIARLAEGRALWGNSPSVVRRVRDPWMLAEALARHGVVVPDLLPAGTQPSLDDESAEWLVKPLASGGGHGVHAWRRDDVVPQSAYLQGFVEGAPASIVFVAARGRSVPLGLTRQLVGDEAFGASGFRYCGNILATANDTQFDRDAELVAAASALAGAVARELGLVGVNGIDFIAHDGVPVPIEVNPRYSASMELVERAYCVSIFAVHAAACAGDELPLFDLERARQAPRALGKAILFARHDVTCGDTRPWLDDPTVRDVPHPGEPIPSGRPVCTVFAEGADSTECYASLVRRAEEVYSVLDAWAAAGAAR
jgi:uncharacterized protein